MCHKADGTGYAAMKTPDFTNKEWQASRTDEQMIETITKGKKPMPAFEAQLKAEQIKLLVTDVVRKFAQ
jgi:mono/diheme cytochrome c family protein